MLAFISHESKFGPFSRTDVREIGHWLRNAKLAEEADRKGTATAPVVHRGDRPPPSASSRAVARGSSVR